MRESIVLLINGERQELTGAQAFMTLADFLRYQQNLSGTKVVCAEGDCGACTVLVARLKGQGFAPYQAINSCIVFLWQLEGCHVITVEGLKEQGQLHPVQAAMVASHGAQCGYCTPGFICSMAAMTEAALAEGFRLTEKKVRNYLTGNLCRCTGYEAILAAGCATELNSVKALATLYNDSSLVGLLPVPESVTLKHQQQELQLPQTLVEALNIKALGDYRIVSGATDLGVLYNKGKWRPEKLLSLMAIPELSLITETPNRLVIGARVSLASLERATEKLFPELSRLLHVFASPQIKNSGTLVGNLMNASPIADTIPFLKVAGAELVVASSQGTRIIDVNDFFLPGYKQMDIHPHELVTHVRLPKTRHHYKLYKVARRKDLDISAVTIAIRYQLKAGRLSDVAMAFGGVGPSVQRFAAIEKMAEDQLLTKKLMTEIGDTLDSLIHPLSDVRGSEGYRRRLCRNLLLKFADEATKEAV